MINATQVKNVVFRDYREKPVRHIEHYMLDEENFWDGYYNPFYQEIEGVMVLIREFWLFKNNSLVQRAVIPNSDLADAKQFMVELIYEQTNSEKVG